MNPVKSITEISMDPMNLTIIKCIRRIEVIFFPYLAPCKKTVKLFSLLRTQTL